MGLSQFSANNVTQSLALVLADQLLAENYLVYWHDTDAMLTPDGWYFEYTSNEAALQSDATFTARYDAAVGILTLTDEVEGPANKEWVTRHRVDGTVPGTQTELAVPVLAVEVGPLRTGRAYEHGSKKHWRYRNLCVYGYARDKTEAKQLADLLGIWFDKLVAFDVDDHDAGTQAAVGSVQVIESDPDWQVVKTSNDARSYEVVLHGQLEFVA